VLFIIDGTTDETFLRQTIEQAWNHMKPTSPNRGATSGLLRMFRLGGLHDRELQQILRVLSLTATTTPSTQSST
jgi:hypothetical protein